MAKPVRPSDRHRAARPGRGEHPSDAPEDTSTDGPDSVDEGAATPVAEAPAPRLAARLRARVEAAFPGLLDKADALLTSLPLPTTQRERRIFGGLGLAIGLTLLLPFVLRSDDRPSIFTKADDRLTILTPHNETIRREFTEGFQKWYQARTGRTVRLDWRTPGGTSEIVKVISSEYHAAFEHHWKKHGPRSWQDSFGRAFSDAKLDRKPGDTSPPTPDQEIRAAFLASNVGIGVDLFFGGGTYDFERQRKNGVLVAADASGQYGLAALEKQRPDWFSDAVIPESVGGEPYRDPGLTWVGSCLSSFGIVYNADTVARLGLPPPTRWQDLADPRYYGQIAVADPAKSGSIVKAFEMIVQQQMRETLEAARPRIDKAPPKMRDATEAAALREGWVKGLQLLQRIGANARYFTESATKVPLDVAQGVAAAGMCIDFYGRTWNERLRGEDGTSRVRFVTPLGGTSTGVDAIAMFRGAPNPAVAHAFLEYVLAPEGQALWNQRPGTPGGPRRMSLRRLPVRKDMYTPAYLAHAADPDVRPYEHAAEFTYVPGWTANRFNALRLGVRAMCIDTHDELTDAWKDLIAAGFPPLAMEQFGAMGQLAADPEGITTLLASNDKLIQVKLARTLGAQFRRSYELARAKAKRAK
jgi:iron(III) transport system substrate-binding protein